MTTLYLDIETIPAQRPDVLAEIRESKLSELDSAISAVKAPGNYGAEAAAKWMAEKGQPQIEALQAAFASDVDAAYRKTSFDGAYGQICVIGYAVDDDEPHTYHVAGLTPEAERDMLEEFSFALTELISPNEILSTTVIGHNVAAFDLRFLAQRHMLHGMRPHTVIGRAAQAKPWESEKVFDTMVQWAGIGNRITLDKLCKALYVPTPKGELDGSKVWDFVKAGRIAEVAAYCRKDVAATRAVHRRMTYQAVIETEAA